MNIHSVLSWFIAILALAVVVVVLLVPHDPVAETSFAFVVSTSPERAGPIRLQGATIAGDVYIFITPDVGVERVSFFINDADMTGQPFQVEYFPPYDFAGGSASTANPFDTTRLSDGSHTLSAVIETSTGATSVMSASFTVRNSPDPSLLMVSDASIKSEAMALEGQELAGQVYIFLQTALEDIASVAFFLDDNLTRVEYFSPYDFAGGSASTANPFDTSTITDGVHQITTILHMVDGDVQTITATFAVNNNGSSFPLTYFAGDDVPDTTVSIVGEEFYINGSPTYRGKTWNGNSIQGLLLNARLVNGIYDDLDGSPPAGMLPWDARANTEDFILAMPSWKSHGLNSFTINLQGGSNVGNGLYNDDQYLKVLNNPYGSSGDQAFDDWESGIASPEARYLQRLGSIIREADDLGMVVILGLFYFGQDDVLADEQAVLNAVDAVTDWILQNGWTNVIIEIDNEAGSSYDHAILRAGRVLELVERVKKRSGGSLLVSTSLAGGFIPSDSFLQTCDFVLLHGNGQTPSEIRYMVQQVRSRLDVLGLSKPIVFNEDSTNLNNFRAAVEEGAGWGYHDSYGYQTLFPTTDAYRWTVTKASEPGFWQLLTEMTGK